MRALARRSRGFAHEVEIRTHRLTLDEPLEQGGDDRGPTPQEMLAASLATCTAITLEMYAERKGWDLGRLEVECDYTPADRGTPTHFHLVIRLPERCSEEQRQRLQAIAARCPVHRTLAGEVTFDEQIEFAEPP